MTQSELYRLRARDCIAVALAAPDLDDRQHYFHLAIIWNDMANRAQLAAFGHDPLALSADSANKDGDL